MTEVVDVVEVPSEVTSVVAEPSVTVEVVTALPEQVEVVEVATTTSVIVVEQAQPITVVATSVGPAGPAGVAGPAGAAGPAGPAGVAGPPGAPSFTYVHEQLSPASTWDITHDLGGYPNVSVVDSAGGEVVGEIAWASPNGLTLVFSVAFAGRAFLS